MPSSAIPPSLTLMTSPPCAWMQSTIAPKYWFTTLLIVLAPWPPFISNRAFTAYFWLDDPTARVSQAVDYGKAWSPTAFN